MKKLLAVVLSIAMLLSIPVMISLKKETPYAFGASSFFKVS